MWNEGDGRSVRFFFSQLFFATFAISRVRIATLLSTQTVWNRIKRLFSLRTNSFGETLIMHFCSRSEESYEGRRARKRGRKRGRLDEGKKTCSEGRAEFFSSAPKWRHIFERSLLMHLCQSPTGIEVARPFMRRRLVLHPSSASYVSFPRSFMRYLPRSQCTLRRPITLAARRSPTR